MKSAWKKVFYREIAPLVNKKKKKKEKCILKIWLGLHGA